MARPALSAARTTEVLDLLTAFPDRAFKMSEIIQATKINVASCHAVLNVLTKRGYLARTPERTYVLGPALVPLGQAASKAHPLIDRAQTAARDLFQSLHVPVILTTLVEDELLVLTTVTDRSTRRVNLRAGQRQPAAAPLGALQVAWASEEVIEAWIARAGVADEALIESWRRNLDLVRKRGFQVLLQEPQFASYGEMITQMAATTRPMDEKDSTLSFLNTHRMRFTQPEEILPTETYDVVSICAPILAPGAEANMSLCLGAFPDKLTGAQVDAYVQALLRACLWVMRDSSAL